MKLAPFLVLSTFAASPALAEAYIPIVPSRALRTIQLTGTSMTVVQVVGIARYGARVRLSDTARKRSADACGLSIEARRRTDIFTCDPLSVKDEAILAASEGRP